MEPVDVHSEDVLEARVIKGERVLTRRFGDGWREAINLGRLNVASPTCCIIGQLYTEVCGDSASAYSYGIRDLMRMMRPRMIQDVCGMHFGFAAESEADYRTLRRIWSRRITDWLQSREELPAKAPDTSLAISA